MWHTFLHIYGPIAIHGYGSMIALGLLLFIYLIQKDSRFVQLHVEQNFTSILLFSIIMGLLGGRILFFITYPNFYENIFDFFTFFNGGFSILGCIGVLLIALPIYLYCLHIPIIPFLDVVAIYAPLLQSISRIGCFLAGCCYGIPTNVPWGIMYTAHDSIAPLHICLHPTQLYSAIGLLIIFILLYFILQYRCSKKGQLLCAYIFLVGLERFLVEFWRWDKAPYQLFSLNQTIALGMVIGALIGFYITTRVSKHTP